MKAKPKEAGSLPRAHAKAIDLRRLEALVAPLSAADFLSSKWPTKPHLSNARKPLLRELIEQPELRDIDSFADMPCANGGWLAMKGRRRNKLNLKPQDQRARYLEGWTIYRTRLVTSTLQRWMRSLDRVLGLPAGTAVVNGFASPPGAGVGWHWDAQELFIVQARGRKLWRLAPNHIVKWPCINGDAEERPAPQLAFQMGADRERLEPPKRWKTVEMTPGSVLFLPRGYWHATENIDPSVHLVLQCRMPSWLDMAIRILSFDSPFFYSPEWRVPPPSLARENITPAVRAAFRRRLASLEAFALPAVFAQLCRSLESPR